MMKQIRVFPVSLKHKQPPPKDLSGFMIIESNVQMDHNVIYVSGEYDKPSNINNKKKQTCLLVRFANYCEDPSQADVLPMLMALRNKICGETQQRKRSLKRELFECKRLSGSAGHTSINNNFFKAIGSKYFLPRPTKACKIVRTSTQFIIYYKKSNNTKKMMLMLPISLLSIVLANLKLVAKHHLTPNFSQTFLGFVFFSASKYTAACIMDYVNKTHNVFVELDVIHVAFEEVKEIFELCIRSCKEKRRLKMMSTYASRQNISVVGYPCCFHQDYTGTLPSLENKKCFEIKLWSNKGVGRGGGSPGTFVVAFLDWTSHKSGSRRQDYLSLTRSLTREVPRVTEQMWVRQFGFSYDSYRNMMTQQKIMMIMCRVSLTQNDKNRCYFVNT